MLIGTCVRWPHTGIDENGSPIVGDPVEVRCRWETKNEEYIAQDGTRQVSSGVIYVESDFSPGDFVREGAISDIDSSITDLKDIRSIRGVWEVRAFNKSPTFRKGEFLRSLMI